MTQAGSNKLKLMVVDDEPDNLDLLYRTFRRDFTVFKADSAITALGILDQEGEMAVIISDQRMPVMNGTEFLSKTVENFPETIRILLTGYTDVEDLVDAINSGQVFKYITKPWNPENLKSVVEQAADTYKYTKRRTNELRHALQREELFNAITTAIRESLDYASMLSTIAQTIGKNFGAAGSILRPVDRGKFNEEYYSYQEEGAAGLDLSTLETLITEVLQQPETKLALTPHQPPGLVIPLIYQQELLAVLCVYQAPDHDPWTSDERQLMEAVVEQASLAISQAKLYQRTQEQAAKMRAELEVARQIQNNLLRQSWPESDAVKVQALCHAAREVGGDFFEVYFHPQGDIWLAVGDVSGKGVPAALFMASGISVLRRELAQEISPEPETVMRNLNNSMAEDLFSTNCFITMILARYTPATKRLSYANAGHIYPMVWHHQQVNQQQQQGETSVQPNFLKARGVPVGILAHWKGQAGELTLNSGEVFLLTSDGITEATLREAIAPDGTIRSSEPGKGTMLEQEGLWQLLVQEEAPLDLSHLLAQIREHTSNIQEDDQTILSLEIL
ncbi:MAG: SpoIIE family protein phosphatase [Coleofasciculaceae cyanobacterium SM2_1_6]|nr:SpoIIE family protein phosphatase [Coleofasciculaceae cyanobacterium SM2_1_6]